MPRPLTTTIRALPSFGRRLARTPNEIGEQALLLHELTMRVQTLEALVEQLHGELTAVDPRATHEVVCAVRDSVEVLSTDVAEHLNRVAAEARSQGA